MADYIDELIKETEAESVELDAIGKHEREMRSRRQTIAQSLKVNVKLSKANRYLTWGNGLGDIVGGQVVLFTPDLRVEGQPNERTTKGSASNYLTQDARDAVLALANVVEKTAALIWRENEALAREKAIPVKGPYGTICIDDNERDHYTYPSQCIHAGLGGEAGDVLRSEVSAFVNQYGLMHMPSGNKPFDSNSWLRPIRVSFIPKDYPQSVEAFKKTVQDDLRSQIDYEARAQFVSKAIDQAGLPRYPDISFEQDQSNRRHVEQSLKDIPVPLEIYEEVKEWITSMKRGGFGSYEKTAEQAYAKELSSFAKDFSWMEDFETKRQNLKREQSELDSEAQHLQWLDRAYGSDDDEQKRIETEEKIERLQAKSAGLHFDFDDILRASRNAPVFLGKDGDAIAANGIWKVSTDAYYYAALLIHDALEMIAAINGDEDALTRLLPLFHMAMFEPAEDCRWAANRYTLWFESVGRDADNPSSEMGEYKYDWSEDGRMVGMKLSRDPFEGKLYGCGWRRYVLCKSNETPERFRAVVKRYLPEILDGLISEGKTHNHKNRFAKAGSIDTKHPTIRVNDFESDLFATLWSVLGLVAHGELELDYIRCEVCGGLKRVKRKAGSANSRKTCSDACRQRLSRGDVRDGDLRLRSDYRDFMLSGADIRIGSRKQEPSSFPESADESGDSIMKIVRQVFGLKS